MITNDQQIAILKLERQQLAHDNTMLRNRLRERSGHAKRVRRAFEDGLLMATIHIGHAPTSRAFMRNQGMSHRRWEAARALLTLAYVHDARHWLIHDLADIGNALQIAWRHALIQPESFRRRIRR